MNQPVLVDTGPLVSLLDDKQEHHRACKGAFANLQLPLFTCLPVLTEAAYLLRKHPQKMRELLATANGKILYLYSILEDDMPGINTILEKYGDQNFDFADACLMHLANREKIDTVFTLDRKDFLVFRNARHKPLALVDIDRENE